MNTYLYNDVELPALPEIPKSITNKERSYVAIAIEPDGSYWLHATTTPITYDGEHVVVNGARWFGWVDNGEWVGDSALGGYITLDSCIWSNHDIINSTDSTVYLAASDPEPVGGEPEPTLTESDFYKVINGKWVKCDAVKPMGSEWVKQPQKGYETQGGQWSALS